MEAGAEDATGRVRGEANREERQRRFARRRQKHLLGLRMAIQHAPDGTLPLAQTVTPEQTQRAIAHLNGKLTKTCPACGHNDFHIAGVYFSPQMDPVTGNITVDTGLPMVHVFCKNCYLVLQFAAVPMGIMKASP